jgi:hypothetical protein
MPDSRHDLTAADLAAARQRDPATVTRIYQAHANALFRFFLASTGDEQPGAKCRVGAAVESIGATRRATAGWPGCRVRCLGAC